jgi:hypothetical protein
VANFLRGHDAETRKRWVIADPPIQDQAAFNQALPFAASALEFPRVLEALVT